MPDSSENRAALEQGFGYLLQVFPKYSETFILNELLEHQRQGRSVPVLSLRLPREGRFHGYLARLERAAEYVPESFWDHPRKIREGLNPVIRKERSALMRALGHMGRGEVTLRDVWQAALVRRWAERRKINHVHCHFGGFAATVAYLARKMGGPSYSVTLHAHEIFRDRGGQGFLHRVIEESAFCITVTQFNAAHLIEKMGVRPERVRVVHNGIPLDRFPMSRATRRPGSIVAVGRLIEKKGFIHLIRSCRLLADRGRLTRCEIVGEGREKDVLAAEIRRLGLTDRVELVGAWPQERVAEALATSAVFALPCVMARDGNMDALPTVILEAMAAGCPVVSTRLSGIPEMIVHGESGLLVSPTNEEELAGAIDALLADEGLATCFAQAARRRVEEQFDIRKSVARLARCLEHPEHGDDRLVEPLAAPRATTNAAPETQEVVA